MQLSRQPLPASFAPFFPTANEHATTAEKNSVNTGPQDVYVIIEHTIFAAEASDRFVQFLGRLPRCTRSVLPPASMDPSRDRGPLLDQGYSHNHEEDWPAYALCRSDSFPGAYCVPVSDEDPGARDRNRPGRQVRTAAQQAPETCIFRAVQRGVRDRRSPSVRGRDGQRLYARKRHVNIPAVLGYAC